MYPISAPQIHHSGFMGTLSVREGQDLRARNADSVFLGRSDPSLYFTEQLILKIYGLNGGGGKDLLSLSNSSQPHPKYSESIQPKRAAA